MEIKYKRRGKRFLTGIKFTFWGKESQSQVLLCRGLSWQGEGLIIFKYSIALSKCRNVEGMGVTQGEFDGQKQKRVVERFTLLFILKE